MVSPLTDLLNAEYKVEDKIGSTSSNCSAQSVLIPTTVEILTT